MPRSFSEIFPKEFSVIGMIHLLAMPGTPLYRGSVQEILDKAMQEASIYVKADIDALMIENMHDVPYLKRDAVGDEVATTMTIIAHELRKEYSLPIGIQILAGANIKALCTAKSSSLDFIRCEGFVFGHLADEGYIDSDAGQLLRYRKQIDADNILIFSDIKKKHSAHAISSDVDIVETAKAAAFFRSDGLIVTGNATGQAADLEELQAIQENVELPILVGSGIDAENILTYRPFCDAVIVGSYFKKQGYWANDLEERRIEVLLGML